MADPSNADDDFPEDEGESGGGESTVSMASPTIDPSMPLPISIAPPAITAPGGGMPLQMQIPTAPVPFTPSGPVSPAGVPQARLGAGGPSVPTPFGGLTPGTAPKPLPAAGAPPFPGVAGAAQPQVPGMPPGMKRPQTVIGLAPPPVGAPRPGAPGGGGARGVPLPSGRIGSPPRSPAGAAAAAMPAPEKGPPSSGRGVKPPVPASSPKPVAPAPSSSGKSASSRDADSTDRQTALTENETPDSQKEDSPTMAKSLGESLALFGLDSGLTDAARAAVVPKPGHTPPQPPVMPGANRSPLATSLAGQNRPAPPPLPPPPPNVHLTEPLPVLHDRSEEEESTRAVSREEMLRGHDAVILPEDGEAAEGEDATLAVMPGFNEAANSKHLAALAETLTHQQHQQQHPQQHEPPPPSNPQPFDPGFPPGLNQGYPQHQQGYPQQPQAMQGGYPDPNQPYGQQQQPAYAQSVTPQQPWGQPQQDPYQQQQGWNQQAYPGSVGPVSGPHLPTSQPMSQPHFPGAQMPQSNPHLQVPQSGHMPVQQAQQQMGMPGGPIPYPGQPMMHQPPPNPFGDWNHRGALAGGVKRPFKISGQILLLGIVGLVCLAIFVTGIILFVTTKF